MAAAFNDNGYKNEFVQSLQKAIKGSKANYKCLPHQFNRLGAASGELIGGNLCMIAHSIGSKSAYSTKDKILF